MCTTAVTCSLLAIRQFSRFFFAACVVAHVTAFKTEGCRLCGPLPLYLHIMIFPGDPGIGADDHEDIHRTDARGAQGCAMQ